MGKYYLQLCGMPISYQGGMMKDMATANQAHVEQMMDSTRVEIILIIVKYFLMNKKSCSFKIIHSTFFAIEIQLKNSRKIKKK